MEVHEIVACCEPVLASPLSPQGASELAAAFKLLGDPVRLRLLSLVANAPAGEVCVCELTVPLERSQPTVSHHVGALVDAGLLAREQRGRWVHLRVVPERLAILRDVLAMSPSTTTRDGVGTAAAG